MTRDEKEKRFSLNYLQAHNGSTGLTVEEALECIDPKYHDLVIKSCDTLSESFIAEDHADKKSPQRQQSLNEHIRADGEYWKRHYPELIEEGDIYLNEHPEALEQINEIAQKKSNIRHVIDSSTLEIKPFQVRKVYYPYFDKRNRYEYHPTFPIPYKNEEGIFSYRFIFVTSGKNTNKVFRFYETPLNDYEEAGLEHLSYARLDKTKAQEDLVFVKDSGVRGFISLKDANSVLDMRNKFNKDVFKNPIAFMSWLIDNRISDPIPADGGNNNNVNAIQTIEDINYSKTANCVDIAIVSYKMTKNVKDISSATISSVTWPIKNKPGSSNGHIFMMFKIGKFTYVFDYDQEHYTGTFRYWYGLDYLEVATKFSNTIRKAASNKDIRNSDPDQQKVIILTPDQLNELNDLSHFKTQRDWLRSIKSEDLNPVKEHTMFNSLSVFDKLIFNLTSDMKKAGH